MATSIMRSRPPTPLFPVSYHYSLSREHSPTPSSYSSSPESSLQFSADSTDVEEEEEEAEDPYSHSASTIRFPRIASPEFMSSTTSTAGASTPNVADMSGVDAPLRIDGDEKNRYVK
jgi:hypothetical protein